MISSHAARYPREARQACGGHDMARGSSRSPEIFHQHEVAFTLSRIHVDNRPAVGRDGESIRGARDARQLPRLARGKVVVQDGAWTAFYRLAYVINPVGKDLPAGRGM